MTEKKEIVEEKKEVINIDKFTHIISSCSKCSALNKCKHFAKEFQTVKKEVEIWRDEEIKKTKESAQLDEINKHIRLEDIQQEAKKMFRNKLIENNSDCIFEKQIIEDTITSINDQFKLSDNPYIISIVEQILKLKIYDFRLMIGHNHYGLFEEFKGKVKLVPGLHYSMEISDKIGNLLEKLNNIINGTKMSLEITERKTFQDILQEIKDADIVDEK